MYFVRVTVGDSGLCCCTCVKVFRALINSPAYKAIRKGHHNIHTEFSRKQPYVSECCLAVSNVPRIQLSQAGKTKKDMADQERPE